MYDSIPGFARAQAAYDNMEAPGGDGCECLEVWECDECSAEHEGPQDKCSTQDCVGSVEYVERRTDHDGAEQTCPEHGWCGGCSSRYCEDCNG